MDPLQVGGFVGAALAAFAASWGTLVRPMKKQVKEELESSQRGTRERIARLEEAVERLGADLREETTRLERTTERLMAKMDAVATIDEFRAYSDHTTKAVNQLTEKVGLVTGAVDALRRG